MYNFAKSQYGTAADPRVPYQFYTLDLTDNVLDQVMTGKLPWGTLRPQAVVVKLMRKERPRRPTSTMLTDKIWEYVDTKCWALTPDERPSANEVEIFINDLYDLSQRVIHCDPLHEL